MEITLITPSILTSKAAGTAGTVQDKISAEQAADCQAAVSRQAGSLHQNTAAAAASFRHPFLSSIPPAANTDGSYTVDGVSFSRETMAQCRSVMQTAVSGIETSGTLDYLNHAQMSIAANAVQAFAETHLSQEQAEVLSNTMQNYQASLRSNQQAILSDGSYHSAYTGEASAYYGIQKAYSDAEIQAINDLIDEMNRVSGGNKPHVGRGFTATVASATNQPLINRISDVFANLDVSDSAAVQSAMEQYQTLLTPVLLANGINNHYGALTRVLDSHTGALSGLIDKIAASANGMDTSA